MTSKFFTWTKGDRKHAVDLLSSGGVIPIPVECISFKGVDPKGTPKVVSWTWKSSCADIGQFGTFSHRSSTDSAPRSPPSLALHDAAVESATSLMAVVNDLLRSPHISAHLSQRGSDLGIPYGRPRSRTAPSSPRPELPPMEPFELPGSIPVIDRQSLNAFAPPRNNSAPVGFGHAIRQYSSSPQPTAEAFPAQSRISIDSRAGSTRPDVRTCSHSSEPITGNISHEGSESSRTPSFTAVASRPPLTVLQPSGNGTSHDRSINLEAARHDDSEATLMQQITMMRSSHDTHVRSLKNAHDQEIASHLAYIAFLERRHTTAAESTRRQPLKIDTAASPAPSELPGLEVSSTTLQSSDTSLDGRSSQDVLTEIESLRRKLSLVRKEQAESADLAQQRAQMRDSLEQKDRRILQLKELTKRAKENEKLLRNTISDLEARLLAANDQRLDVLEGFDAISSTFEAISKEKSALVEVLPRPFAAVEVPPAIGCSLSSTSPDVPSPCSYSVLLASLQTTLKEKDEQIKRLQTQAQTRVSSENHNAERFTELQNRLDEGQEAFTQVTKDRDRYYSLLQGEIRRNARHAVRTYPMSPAVTSAAVNKAQAVLSGVRATAAESPNDGSSTVSALLEKELQHCLGEIIMYKLDVQGYRKDLKDVKAELEGLYTNKAPRPITPPRSVSRNRAQRGISQGRSSRQGGLGITISSQPATPPRSVASAKTDSLFAPSDTTSNLSTPNHRPMTPAVARKRTSRSSHSQHSSPYPAVRTSPPTLKLSRAETMKSLSESIIVSYTSPQLLEAGVLDYGRHGLPNTRGRSPSLVNIERKLISVS